MVYNLEKDVVRKQKSPLIFLVVICFFFTLIKLLRIQHLNFYNLSSPFSIQYKPNL